MARVAVMIIASMALTIEANSWSHLINKTAKDISALGADAGDRHTITGTLIFTADDGLTTKMVEAGTQYTLAARMGESLKYIGVAASKSRRLLTEKAEPSTEAAPRKLGTDTWTVAYDVNMNISVAEDVKAKARLHEGNTLLFQDTLRQNLRAVGAPGAIADSAAITSIVQENITAAVEEEADGASTISCNFVFAFVAFMVASLLTK